MTCIPIRKGFSLLVEMLLEGVVVVSRSCSTKGRCGAGTRGARTESGIQRGGSGVAESWGQDVPESRPHQAASTAVKNCYNAYGKSVPESGLHRLAPLLMAMEEEAYDER